MNVRWGKVIRWRRDSPAFERNDRHLSDGTLPTLQSSSGRASIHLFSRAARRERFITNGEASSPTCRLDDLGRSKSRARAVQRIYIFAARIAWGGASCGPRHREYLRATCATACAHKKTGV